MDDENSIEFPTYVSKTPRGRIGWTAEKMAQVPAMKERIVEGLKRGEPMNIMCEELGVNPRTVERWGQGDIPFRDAMRDAREYYIDLHEMELQNRVLVGVPRPVLYQGRIVRDTTKPVDPETGQHPPLILYDKSDSNLQFMLRSRRREIYGDRSEVSTTMQVDIPRVRDELRRAFAQAGGSGGEGGTSSESE